MSKRLFKVGDRVRSKANVGWKSETKNVLGTVVFVDSDYTDEKKLYTKEEVLKMISKAMNNDK